MFRVSSKFHRRICHLWTASCIKEDSCNLISPTGKCVPSRYLSTEKKKQVLLGRTNSLLSIDTTRKSQKTTPPTILRCRQNVPTEPLPSIDIWGYTYRHTGWWEVLRNLSGLRFMICMPNFVYIGSGIEKLMWAGLSQTHRIEIA
jgi:hypothetical protein